MVWYYITKGTEKLDGGIREGHGTRINKFPYCPNNHHRYSTGRTVHGGGSDLRLPYLVNLFGGTGVHVGNVIQKLVLVPVTVLVVG